MYSHSLSAVSYFAISHEEYKEKNFTKYRFSSSLRKKETAPHHSVSVKTTPKIESKPAAK
jgi:hypothetical protein